MKIFFIGNFQPEMLGDIQFKEVSFRYGTRVQDGFNTHIGENGAMLSGGQGERFAIARALYRSLKF